MLRRVRWRRLIAWALVLAVLACNGIAWMQARAMTHFSSGGERTPPIEAMTLPQKAWALLTGVNVPRPQNTHTPQEVGLQHSVHTVGFQNGDTLEAWHIPNKEQRGMVLLFPAYAESKESLLPQAAAFNGMGYSAFMVDFRGVGGSSGDSTTLGIREGKDVARAVEYVQQTWPRQRIILYGASMGSAAILRAIAAEGVRADAAVLESPFNRLLDTVRNRFNAMGLPQFPAAELVVFWGGAQQGFDGFGHNPEEYATSVQCPTLILHGEKDPRVTSEQASAIYNRLGGYKEFVSFAGARHESLVVVSPDVWKGRVTQFLSERLKCDRPTKSKTQNPKSANRSDPLAQPRQDRLRTHGGGEGGCARACGHLRGGGARHGGDAGAARPQGGKEA